MESKRYAIVLSSGFNQFERVGLQAFALIADNDEYQAAVIVGIVFYNSRYAPRTPAVYFPQLNAARRDLLGDCFYIAFKRYV